jgi:YbbR domain-containing protein
MEMLKDILKKIKDFFTSGSEQSVVTICFLLSILFWVLIKFSKEYTYYIDYPVSYVNQPVEKYLKEKPLSSLKIKVKGFGFNYLKETFTSRNFELDVSKLAYNKPKQSYYWLTESNLAEMAIQLNGFSIIKIEPDSLFLTYSNKTKKRVPVKVPVGIEYSENYMEYSSLKIEPNEIDVFGPSHLIDTLSVVFTKPLSATDVKDDIEEVLPILFSNKLISSRDLKVTVQQDVERFTQINKIIPIKLKNLPKGMNPYVIPSEVELSFWIAMRDVDKVSDSDFYVYCDYNEFVNSNSSVLNIFLDKDKYPSIVKRVKYSPTTTQFVDIK